MTNNRRVVITGLGAVTAIGIGRENFWKSLLEGKSGISPISSIDTRSHFTHNGGEIRNFKQEEFISEENRVRLSRASKLALASATLAVQDAGLRREELSKKNAGVCIGITSGSVQTIENINNKLLRNQEISSLLSGQLPAHSTPAVIANHFNLKGTNIIFSSACAAGNYALGYGFDLIRFNRADIILAGAADPFSRISFTGFNQFSAVAPEKCQPFDKNRKGMIVSEGAGILVLESLESALSRHATIYAELLGYGLSCDAFHMTTSSIDGIADCMKAAIKAADIGTSDVDYISAHGTGTQTNDKNECAAIKRIFGPRYQKIPISSIKSMLGHTMGAASALEAIACALVVKTDWIPPTVNFETPDPECDIDCVPNIARTDTVNIALNNSYAFGGNNACLVFKKFIA